MPPVQRQTLASAEPLYGLRLSRGSSFHGLFSWVFRVLSGWVTKGLDFLRHSSGVPSPPSWKKRRSGRIVRAVASWTRPRPGYPLSGCVPASRCTGTFHRASINSSAQTQGSQYPNQHFRNHENDQTCGLQSPTCPRSLFRVQTAISISHQGVEV